MPMLIDHLLRDPEEEKPEVISLTKAAMWLRCPRQVYFRYELGIVEPPRGATALGRAVHVGLANAYRDVATGGKFRADVALDAYGEAFRTLKPHVWKREDEDLDTLEGLGYDLLEAYAKELGPQYVPDSREAVEMPVMLELLPGLKLRGYIDLIANDGIIVDHKVTKRASQAADKARAQLHIYQWAVGQLRKKLAGLELHVMPHSKRPQRIPIEFADEAQLAWYLRVLEEVAAAIVEARRTETWLPAPFGSWYCSPKWCAYWDRCHRTFT